jgi:hypothetical protein
VNQPQQNQSQAQSHFQTQQMLQQHMLTKQQIARKQDNQDIRMFQEMRKHQTK